MNHLYDTASPLEQDLLINAGEGTDFVIDNSILYVKIDLVKLIEEQIAIQKKEDREHKRGYQELMSKLICTPNDITLNRELNEELGDSSKSLIHWWCLGTILMCNNAKVNKSSVNWSNFVKLTNEILEKCNKAQVNEEDLKVIGDLKLNKIDRQYIMKRCLKVVIKSIRQHPRNYYCGNGINSMIKTFGYNFVQLMKDEIVKIDDLTLWVNWSNGLLETNEKALILEEIEWLYSKLIEKYSVIAMMKAPSFVMARLLYWRYQNEMNNAIFDFSKLSKTIINLYDKYVEYNSFTGP